MSAPTKPSQAEIEAQAPNSLSGHRPPDPLAKPKRKWGRPEFVTAYRQDMALFNTRPKLISTLVLIGIAAALPFLIADDLLEVLAVGYISAVGAIGLNIVTGYAGQVSLGHAFFLGLGAYTAAIMSGDPDDRYLGYGITFVPLWLIAGGLVAAVAGAIVAPIATRLRGLYLAIVTIGLVFIGEHFFREWKDATGGPGVGRPTAVPEMFGADLSEDGAYTEEQKLYWLGLVVLIIMGLLARNLVRSKIGRAFAAVRDRDIAAGVMGVNLSRYKLIAFTISSFYAGVCGALLYVPVGFFDPNQFGLLLSVSFIAMVLIGGAATISGAIMGALFITLLPRVTRELPDYLPFISSSATENPNVYQLETVLYGGLIIVFLLFEPRGLFGIWQRIRTYWKSFPFSY